MHYSELHGDLPINAIQAFGGYLAMGAEYSVYAWISQAKGDLKKVYSQVLNECYPKGIKVTDAKGQKANAIAFCSSLVAILKEGVKLGKVSQAKCDEARKFILAADGTKETDAWIEGKSDADIQATCVAVDKITREALGVKEGMSTMTKVLIGVGIAAVVGGGIYYYKTRNDD